MIRSLSRFFSTLLVCAVVSNQTCPLQAADLPTEEGIHYFENHIRPVLATHCYECHSSESSKLKGSLYLDSKAGILRGGDSGAILAPGRPEESLLIKVVRYQVEDLEMPPKKKLPASMVSHFVTWVTMGAPIPEDGSKIAAKNSSYDFEKFRREHWAFRPLHKPAPPTAPSGRTPSSPIDAFVLARMKGSGLNPAPRANSRTLIRRAYFTLIGLPPTPEEVEAFLQDSRPDAFARVIDRLLASPHYGERWGRHWLDVARYSDGMGASQDSKPLPNAWRYRDWVVNAFNSDLPYDQFVKFQIAGDLFGEGHALATGFFAVGPTYTSDGGDPESKAQAEAETLADRVDTFSRAFLALTAACARCHDHKFDPITAADYYAIAGIFRNSKPRDIPVASEAERNLFSTIQSEIKAQEKVIQEFLDRKAQELNVSRKDVESRIVDSSAEELKTLRSQLEKIRSTLPPKPGSAHGLGESGSGDMHIAIRGDLRKKGPVAPRKFLEIVAGPERPHFTEGSGRRQLAEAVADPRNPLTARVMVNRVWLQHFGRALVRSPSNFGVIGQKPTHPALLDWLAASFIENGWSMKKLHREIMLSSTWQQSTSYNPEAFAKDGDNRLIWRMNPRRLDIEAWRDSLLLVSGDLDAQVGGAPDEHVLESRRRTIYGKISRNFDRSVSEEFLRIFDFPAPRSSSAARTESTVPQQYLFILNSPFMIARAKNLAERLRQSAPDDASRVDLAYSILFQRVPQSLEKEAGLKYLAQHEDSKKSWLRYAQVLLGTHEFMQVE